MGMVTKIIRRFWRDDQAQATTEYILLLSIAASLGVMVVKKFIGPVLKRLGDGISKKIENQMMGADLHYFRVRK